MKTKKTALDARQRLFLRLRCTNSYDAEGKIISNEADEVVLLRFTFFGARKVAELPILRHRHRQI